VGLGYNEIDTVSLYAPAYASYTASLSLIKRRLSAFALSAGLAEYRVGECAGACGVYNVHAELINYITISQSYLMFGGPWYEW